MIPPLEPRVAAFVAALEAANLPPIDQGTPAEARVLAKALRRPRPVRTIARVENVTIPAAHGGIAARLYCDRSDPPAVILYFHGGGWVLGGLDEVDLMLRELAGQGGHAIVSIDYRLAPEAIFPAAIEDAETAFAWLKAYRAHYLGADLPIAVAGDSAGGNIAAVLAMRARDRGDDTIGAQILINPVTDCAMDTGSYRQFADGPLLTAPLMAWFWNHYIADAATRAHPDASPSRGRLAGLPPAMILTAEADPLRDEAEAYAVALEAAGVSTMSRRYDGQIHSFLTMYQSDGAEAALQDVIAFLRATVG